jgi:drug/metabolite transporter (DMT)-like permease
VKEFRRPLHKDVWGGALMLALGVLVMALGSSYSIGTLSRMGPGYFPLALGVILVLTGVAIAIKGYFTEPEVEAKPLRPEWKAWFLISLSVVAFVVLTKYLGLVPATFGVVFISALADRDNTWKRAAVLALAIVVVSVIVFWWALQIQLPLFRWGK